MVIAKDRLLYRNLAKWLLQGKFQGETNGQALFPYMQTTYG